MFEKMFENVINEAHAKLQFATTSLICHNVICVRLLISLGAYNHEIK